MKADFRRLSMLLPTLLAIGLTSLQSAGAPISARSRATFNATMPKVGSHPLLVRRAGPGNLARASRFLSMLQSRYAFPDIDKVVDKNGHLRVEGSDWVMHVSDEGNNFRARRQRNANVRPIALSAQPDKAKVLADGLDVINRDLGDFVALGPSETLVELKVQYEHLASGAPGAAPSPARVGGWVAVFGRAVNGNLVVGGGSHVAVLFDSAGSVEGFDIDWPTYVETGNYTKAASIDVVKSRGKAMEKALSSSQRRTEVAMDCGYFDSGGRHDRTRVTYLQLGCVRQLRTDVTNLGKGNTVHWADTQAIHASESPVIDLAWSPIVTECNNPDGCP